MKMGASFLTESSFWGYQRALVDQWGESESTTNSGTSSHEEIWLSWFCNPGLTLKSIAMIVYQASMFDIYTVYTCLYIYMHCTHNITYFYIHNPLFWWLISWLGENPVHGFFESICIICPMALAMDVLLMLSVKSHPHQQPPRNHGGCFWVQWTHIQGTTSARNWDLNRRPGDQATSVVIFYAFPWRNIQKKWDSGTPGTWTDHASCRRFVRIKIDRSIERWLDWNT